MSGLHQRLGVAIVALGLFGALWGVALLRTRGAASPGLRSYTLLTLAALLLQGLTGLLLLGEGHRPESGLHEMYGPAMLLFLGGGVAAAPRLDPRVELYALTAGLAAVVLLGIRTVATGGG